MENAILNKILIIPAVLIGLTFHEYAHAYMADRLGDKTPKFQGRLSLNPFVHIDPIGFIMILLIGFGWAKPVQTNPGVYRHYYKDDLKVSLAGPLANLLVALLAALLTALLYKLGIFSLITMGSLSTIIATILLSIISINCMLFVFNLIPIPGLDGFHILRDLFPSHFYKVSDFLYKYQLLILLVFVATPLATYIVGLPSKYLYSMFINLINLIV